MHPSPRAETTSPSLPRFRRSIEPPREINLLDRLSLHNRSGRVASVGAHCCGSAACVSSSAGAEAREGPRRDVLYPAAVPFPVEDSAGGLRVAGFLGGPGGGGGGGGGGAAAGVLA